MKVTRPHGESDETFCLSLPAESVRPTELNPLHCKVSFLLLGLNILTKASEDRKGFIITLSGLGGSKVQPEVVSAEEH